MKTLIPDTVVEWIPYYKFHNIEYLTSGGFSKFYRAVLTDGTYYRWDSSERKLKRFGDQKAILKKVKNVENATQSWLEEVRNLNI